MSRTPPRRRGADRVAAALAIAAVALGGCAAPHFSPGDAPRIGPERVAVEPREEDVRVLPMFEDDGTPIGWDDLLEAVAWADVVVLGEQHDDALGHAVQRAVVEDVFERWPGSTLTMEMLERDEQPVVDDFAEGIIDGKTLAKLTNSENWGADGGWADWYQPIVDAAKTRGGCIIAANAPRRYVRLARTDGYARLRSLPPPRRGWVVPPARVPDGPYRDRFFEVMTAAEHAPPPVEEAKKPADAPAGGDEPAPDDGATPQGAPGDAEVKTHDAKKEPPEAAAATADDEAAGDEQATHAAESGSDENAAAPKDEDQTEDASAGADEKAGTTEAKEEAPEPEFHLTEAQVDAMFRSQLVWDATMADSIARAVRPGRKVVHLVGQFHCDFEGGTVLELRRRRPGARILVISLQRAWPSALRDEDAGRAGIVIYTGERPKEDEEAESEEAKPAEEPEPEPEPEPEAVAKPPAHVETSEKDKPPAP